jgi:hypothetical protein
MARHEAQRTNPTRLLGQQFLQGAQLQWALSANWSSLTDSHINLRTSHGKLSSLASLVIGTSLATSKWELVGHRSLVHMLPNACVKPCCYPNARHIHVALSCIFPSTSVLFLIHISQSLADYLVFLFLSTISRQDAFSNF